MLEEIASLNPRNSIFPLLSNMFVALCCVVDHLMKNIHIAHIQLSRHIQGCLSFDQGVPGCLHGKNK